jgi:hypothetical protein
MNHATAGQARAAELRATTPEEHLRAKAKRLILLQIRDMEINTRRQKDLSIPRPRTQFDAGHIAGQVTAYIDAILALRAGSAYYVDDSWNLRNELHAEAKAEQEGR